MLSSDPGLSSVRSLIQCTVSQDGLLLFITHIPEQPIEESQEKEAPVLQESSNGDQSPNDSGVPGLKSVLSAGKTPSSWPEGSERPVVTFKENIKPREPARALHQKDGVKERRDFTKGSVASGRGEPKRDGKRKSEPKKSAQEKSGDAGKQVES